ncbi:hypothetical protein UPYG_G00309840 [Umbra pygmaea]|uniref:Uncharacterized protein n=1 Tax=Umbra pygmaea TaxID=75934 RepID=A0ABD0W3U3_UMBPY
MSRDAWGRFCPDVDGPYGACRDHSQHQQQCYITGASVSAAITTHSPDLTLQEGDARVITRSFCVHRFQI